MQEENIVMQLPDENLRPSGNRLAGENDSCLVMALQAGSETAFAELNRKYANSLYRKILSITRNHEDAEDVLQETLLRAFLAIDSFEGRSKLQTWLTRIAINLSLMTLRRRRVRCQASSEFLSFSEDEGPQFLAKDPSPNPEEFCLQRERRHRVAKAITTLKSPLRTVMQIQLNEDCSLAQIARSLDVSVAAVKARLHRARRHLAQRTKTEMQPFSTKEYFR
jgi:RNA polymerase sigma-70 factor (ECF subfamily)